MLHLHYYVGISGSGKTTIAKCRATPEEVILSSDAIRAQLWGDESDQQNPQKVFDTMFKEAIAALHAGKNVHYDSTGLSMKHRLHFIKSIRSQFSNDELALHCIIVAAPIEECIERNNSRERVVPEHVIWKQAKSFHVPVENEGWDDIIILHNSARSGESYQRDILDKLTNFGDQKNSHHSLSLIQHSVFCMVNLKSKNENMTEAAFFHDCGKLYTQTFWSKDNYAEAHYPNHAELGSYIALGCELPLYTAQLICYHMRPYEGELARKTWKERLGEQLWNDLLILHEADCSAH